MKIGSKHSLETRNKLSISHKGKPMLPQTREALRNANLGRKCTEETKRKIGESNKGNIPWSKGKRTATRVKIICKVCNKELEDYLSNKRSGLCSLKCYWQSKKGSSGYWKGKSRSFEDRKKMSAGRKGLTAKEKHPKWKGGISSKYAIIRSSFEYKEWRRNVFKRDRFTCIMCGHRSKRRDDIQADHIKRFADFPELRFEISNGRTLCVPCHKRITFNHV